MGGAATAGGRTNLRDPELMGIAITAANTDIWPNIVQAPGAGHEILTEVGIRGAIQGFRAKGDIPNPIFLPPGVKVLAHGAQCNLPLPLLTITIASPKPGHPSL